MFLRAAVLAQPGETRRRVGAALNEVESIVTNLPSAEALCSLLERRSFDLVVLQDELIPERGLELLARIRSRADPPQVIAVGFERDVQRGAALLAAGVSAVIPDSVDDGVFHDCCRKLAERRLEEARAQLREVPDEDYALADYVTTSQAMRRFLRTARRIASRDSTVLLTGETGVGKGVLARSLHNEGPRSGPFVALSCVSLNENLIESELFGHEKGAFTGADRDRRGYFELAHQGTLFLDEIGDLPLHLQVKLLRVLEEREVHPVGAEEPVTVDVRFMAATNRDLRKEVEAGRFREDLYYRLDVVSLRFPSLRDRPEDIPEIARSYVDHYRAITHSDVAGISEEALRCLSAYPWPGNIRELSNAIEHAVILGTHAEIQVADLPAAIREHSPAVASTKDSGSWRALPWREVRRRVLDAAEHRYLREVLTESHGKIGIAAGRAGMAARSFTEKMQKHGLRKEDFRS